MAVTMKQIAELAGVSVGTVDRALNNRGRVDAQVAERIKRIAQEVNYQPNSIAKSLSIRRKNLKIAVILNVTDNKFVASVLDGVRVAAQELLAAGFSVHIMPCKDFDASAQLQLIRQAVAEQFDGIVLIPLNDEKIRQEVNALYDRNYPVLFLTSIIEDANFLTYVGCNYKYSGQISCGILSQVTGGKANLAVLISNLQMWSNKQRLLSIQNYLENTYPGIHLERVLEMSNDNIESYIQAKDLLESSPQIDAVLYCSGAVDGGLKAVLEASRTRNLKIVSFDYTDMIRKAMQDHKILFTITQNPNEQGYQAMKLMSDYLMNQRAAAKQFMYVNTEIMILESIKDSEHNSFR